MTELSQLSLLSNQNMDTFRLCEHCTNGNHVRLFFPKIIHKMEEILGCVHSHYLGLSSYSLIVELPSCWQKLLWGAIPKMVS